MTDNSRYEATRRDRVAVALANLVLRVMGTRGYRDGLEAMVLDAWRWKCRRVDVFRPGWFQQPEWMDTGDDAEERSQP